MVHVRNMNISRNVRITLQVMVLVMIALIPMSKINDTPHHEQIESVTSTVNVRPIPEHALTVFGHSYNLEQYKTKSSTFTLTAYNLDRVSTGKNPGDPGFGVTATGTHAETGRTVAVDPRVIPYGSLLYIKGVGWRIAEDTGGAIRGHHIDVLMTNRSVAMSFGVKRNCEVEVFVPVSLVNTTRTHSLHYS